MTPKKRSLIQLNAAVLIWGGTAMFAKGVAIPVTHIICIRSFVAAAALLLFLVALGKPVRVKSAGHCGIMAGLGLLLCFHWLTFFEALKISTAAVAILSLHTYPVFTALVEPVVFREKLKRTDVVLAGAVFGGVLIMTPELSLSNSTTRGILLGVVSGLFFMVRNLLTRKYVRQYGSSVLMFWQVLVAGVVLLPVLFVSQTVEYPPHAAWLLLLLGVVFTAVPQTLFSSSFETLSAKTVSILATLLPFYGALFGYLIHDETVSPRTAVGGLLILACIAFETAKNVGERAPSSGPPAVALPE